MVEGFINKVKWIKREPLWTSRISLTAAPCLVASKGFASLEQRAETTLLSEVCTSCTACCKRRQVHPNGGCSRKQCLTNEAPRALIHHKEEVKETAMPKRRTSPHGSKDMQVRFDEITSLTTDPFCQTDLHDEYTQLWRGLKATPYRKHPSPLVRGKDSTWACGIMNAAWPGQLSFRFLADPPHYRCAPRTT